VALENVLAINPDNAAARQGAYLAAIALSQPGCSGGRRRVAIVLSAALIIFFIGLPPITI